MDKFIVRGLIRRLAFVTTMLAGCSLCNVGSAKNSLYNNPSNFLPSVPTSYPYDPACKVKSIQKSPSAFEYPVVSSATGLVATTQLDAKGVYQLYVGGANVSPARRVPAFPR